jgi:hypothetical protein
LGSAARLGATLWRYLRHRNPSTRKVHRPRLGPEEARLFRGNFPQLFSHEGLVRTLLALAPPVRQPDPSAAASIDLEHTVR